MCEDAGNGFVVHGTGVPCSREVDSFEDSCHQGRSVEAYSGHVCQNEGLCGE